tara:strand:- start:167 stop:436 length:270 start_codon:yes stop_codon:yes gene_type:complete
MLIKHDLIKPISKDQNEALYIFSWNSGEFIELHTEQTFKEQYNKNTNPELWEEQNEYDFNHFSIMECIFDDNMANEETRTYDNMFVVRL